MRIIFFGTPAFAVPSLQALIDTRHDVAAVITQPDRTKGRGHLMSAPPVKELALSRGIPVIQPNAIRTPEFLEELRAFKPDAIAVVAYGRIIPPAILSLPPVGCINVHGSLLPRYRGASPVQTAIINGDTKTGITTMLMNEGLDTGDILLQEETDIKDEDTAESLGIRLSQIGAALLLKTLQGLSSGGVTPVPQSGEPSFAPPLKKDDGRIDWGLSARMIFNLVRGTYPWPGAFAGIKGERLSVLKSKVIDENPSGVPGKILKISGEGIYVKTGQGTLLLLEVKPSGKPAMPAASFANGRRLKEGVSFDA